MQRTRRQSFSGNQQMKISEKRENFAVSTSLATANKSYAIIPRERTFGIKLFCDQVVVAGLIGEPCSDEVTNYLGTDQVALSIYTKMVKEMSQRRPQLDKIVFSFDDGKVNIVGYTLEGSTVSMNDQLDSVRMLYKQLLPKDVKNVFETIVAPRDVHACDLNADRIRMLACMMEVPEKSNQFIHVLMTSSGHGFESLALLSLDWIYPTVNETMEEHKIEKNNTETTVYSWFGKNAMRYTRPKAGISYTIPIRSRRGQGSGVAIRVSSRAQSPSIDSQ